MDEYIKRKDAIKALCFWCAGDVSLDDGEPCSCLGKKEILDTPAADVVEVKHGYWTTHLQSETTFVCSECALNVSGFERRWIKYCPNCGARMDLKEGAEE